MELINLFFVVVNGWMMVHFLDKGNQPLVFINMLAFILNLFPVVVKLLS